MGVFKHSQTKDTTILIKLIVSQAVLYTRAFDSGNQLKCDSRDLQLYSPWKAGKVELEKV